MAHIEVMPLGSLEDQLQHLAAWVWHHDNGMPWLDAPPLIEMEQGPVRKPYPLSWEEQDRLLRELRER